MKNRLIHFSRLIALAFVVFACSDSDPEAPLGEFDSGILIMNEGNFGTNDGEVYHLDPGTEELKANIFEEANSRPFAGLLEDLVLEDDKLYLVANTGKIEIVDPGDFASLGSVTTDLDQPRSLTVNSDKLFISDYGPYDASYATPDSYIAVVDNTLGGTVSNKIAVSRKPEDLLSSGKYIWVAGSEEGKIEIIDAETEEIIETLDVEGSPKVFLQVEGHTFLYATGATEIYFYNLNLGALAISNTYTLPVANASGRIAIGDNNALYLITSSGWPDYEDAVAKVSLTGGVEENWYTGSGFYGIGFDPYRDEVYVSNSNGFQGNGTVTVLDENAAELRTYEVGRGPSGFLVR
ncbi:YncE family protein [Algoriphagus vanfongensis]|uniref:YncE family protein n=1 Tax=Algoriphagus vanfongensis TaxID=426371 RepID=UPI00047B6E47|nr:DUF5074 domain-containing protein [Algoriphagus vanfongensis]